MEDLDLVDTKKVGNSSTWWMTDYGRAYLQGEIDKEELDSGEPSDSQKISNLASNKDHQSILCWFTFWKVPNPINEIAHFSRNC